MHLEKAYLMTSGPAPTPPIERFLSKVSRDGNDGCWLWTAHKVRGNYGAFYDGTRQVMAHRFSYEHYVGPIPEGHDIDHLCKREPCVNPAHLEAVTPAENSRRRWNSPESAESMCKSGLHSLLEPSNVYVAPDGGTRCRPCRTAAQARYAAKRREAPTRVS